jgi:hypothetical protein
LVSGEIPIIDLLAAEGLVVPQALGQALQAVAVVLHLPPPVLLDHCRDLDPDARGVMTARC